MLTSINSVPTRYPNVVIPAYCSASPFPTITNGNTSATVPVQTIFGVTYIPCAFGFKSTGGSNPYFTCQSYAQTIGVYSAVTYGCTGICKQSEYINVYHDYTVQYN